MVLSCEYYISILMKKIIFNVLFYVFLFFCNYTYSQYKGTTLGFVQPPDWEGNPKLHIIVIIDNKDTVSNCSEIYNYNYYINSNSPADKEKLQKYQKYTAVVGKCINEEQIHTSPGKSDDIIYWYFYITKDY